MLRHTFAFNNLTWKDKKGPLSDQHWNCFKGNTRNFLFCLWSNPTKWPHLRLTECGPFLATFHDLWHSENMGDSAGFKGGTSVKIGEQDNGTVNQSQTPDIALPHCLRSKHVKRLWTGTRKLCFCRASTPLTRVSGEAVFGDTWWDDGHAGSVNRGAVILHHTRQVWPGAGCHHKGQLLQVTLATHRSHSLQRLWKSEKGFTSKTIKQSSGKNLVVVRFWGGLCCFVGRGRKGYVCFIHYLFPVFWKAYSCIFSCIIPPK